MKRILFSLFASMLCSLGAFSQFNLFQNTLEPVRDNRQIVPSSYRTVGVNFEQLKTYLLQAPNENAVQPANSDFIISLPHPNGETWSFRIVETPLFAPEMQAEMPYIRTFTGQGVGDKAYATVKLDFTPKGFHAMVLTPGNSWFIDPYSPEDLDIYISYTRGAFYETTTKTFQELQPFTQGQKFDMTKDPEDKPKEEEQKHKGDKKPKPTPGMFKTVNGTNLRTYILALACTEEYAQFHGNTVALVNAAYTTSMNRINGIFERDMAIRMQIVAGNNGLIFLNTTAGNDDPYSNNNGGTMLGENITTCGSVIGNANFDIGHVFSTGGGGVAYLAGICNNAIKAGGVTGSAAPVGDPFDVDYVAHEMGHQYGANHTQNNNCNRNASTAYEPGSASTIMGYAGICAPDLQSNSDDYFHNISFNEMYNYNVVGGGNACATTTATGNTPPTLTIPAGGWVIPISTPFELTATGGDANGDAITYCWEEFDLGPATSGGGLNSPSGNQPIFRSWDPVTSPTRVFPRLSNLVNNTVPLGELMPTYDRTLTFRCTVRDNRAGGGGVRDAQLAFTVDNIGGPFLVTAPNTAVTWTGGSTQTVTWNVANTTAAPISCSNVDIYLSFDGGFTYPTLLLANTPNDGSQTITVPGTATTQARIKVKAANNIFFDISNVNFTITAASIPGCTDITACNYNPAATSNNGSCTYPGCTNPLACNFNVSAGCDNGSCTLPGCTNAAACNYNALAGCDDGSCVVVSYFDTYADGNFTANPVWSGDVAAWTVTASASSGANSTNSNTLRLNFGSAAAGVQHIRAPFTNWQNEQEWSFWLGRRAQTYALSDNVAVWLYADQANLESGTINGYRILIGDNTGGDEYFLQRVVNGVATNLVTSTAITAGITDHSTHIRVSRSALGLWTFHTSTIPTATGQGPTANVCVNATVLQGSTTDNTIVPSGTGYFGIVATHGSSANARASAELDQISIVTSAVTTGCTDLTACNYDPAALADDGSCTYPGCTDNTACNFDSAAGCNDGSCTYATIWFADVDGDSYGNSSISISDCDQPLNFVAIGGDCNDNNAAVNPGATESPCNGIDDDCDTLIDENAVSGCTNPSACNYNALANCDNGSCTFPGCTNPLACNFNVSAGCDNGSCTLPGCTNAAACNYNASAGCDDGSCVVVSYFDTYADGNFTANPVWSGDVAAWTVTASASSGANSTNSNTLRLNFGSAAAGVQHIRAPFTNWQNEQEWSFWLGRRAQTYALSDNVAVWLYADQANLESGTINGYRILIGDNTGGDEYFLQRVVNGVATNLVTSTAITAGITDHSTHIRVSRSALGLWTFHTSTIPTATGQGPTANVCVNATVLQGSTTDNTIVPSGTGYFGIVATHGSSANARASAELDQISIVTSAVTTGCTDLTACNYDPAALVDNGSCTYPGCTDNTACNFDSAAGCNDGSCTYATIWFADVDGDSYGNSSITISDCDQPLNFVAIGGDCNDNNAAVNPGATESPCNGIDDDCDTLIDENAVSGCTNPSACNFNALANCDNGTCILPTAWFEDIDGDTFGNNSVSLLACNQPVGYVSVSGDCDDNAAAINPGVSENPCNLTDDDCDLFVDEGAINGCTSPAACNYSPSANCDDGSCTFPGCTNPLACNFDSFAGCDNGSCLIGVIWYLDFDSDGFGNASVSQFGCVQPVGYVGNDDDCDDLDFDVNPGVAESPCNSIDDNCNGQIDENSINGCTNPTACNYNALANCDNGSCDFSCNNIPGCTNPIACNFNPAANVDNGSCQLPGCYDPFATNYNPFALCGGGVCVYEPTPLSISAAAFPACNAINGATGTMDPSGLPVNGPNGGNANDDLLYVFNMPVEGAVKVVVNGTGINAVIELLNSSYNFLSAVDANATVGGQEVLFHDGLAAGTYVVRVYDHGNGAGGNFNICISTYASSRVDAAYVNQVYDVCGVNKCIFVSNAIGYDWQFTGQTNLDVLTFTSGTNYTFLALTSLSGATLTYGETYTVKVGAIYNDPNLGSIAVYGFSTDPCAMAVSPIVQLATSYVNGTYQLNQQIKTGQSCNADGYVWRLTPQSGPALADVTILGSTFLTLCDIAGILPGQTYGVQVAVIYDGITYAFGPSLNINTSPYVPVVLRIQDNCANAGAVSLGYTVFTNANRPCAKDYTWEFTSTLGGLPIYAKKGNGIRSIKLSTVAGLQPGESYVVRVKAEYGNFTGFNPLTGEPQYDYVTAFGASDTICLIGGSSAQSIQASDENEGTSMILESDEVLIYPNPAKSHFNVFIQSNEPHGAVGQMQLFDLFGKILVQQNFVWSDENSPIEHTMSNSLAAGIYTLKITLGSQLLTSKVIIAP